MQENGWRGPKLKLLKTVTGLTVGKPLLLYTKANVQCARRAAARLGWKCKTRAHLTRKGVVEFYVV